MKIKNITRNLKKTNDGIYYSKQNSEISYSEKFHDSFIDIEENSFWFKHRNNIISESIKRYNSDKVFFDIGGGNGFVAKRLQDEGSKVILVEPGKTGAMNGYKRGIKHVFNTTLNDAGFEDEIIDSVGLFDVIEHIKDDYLFMCDINKYMKKSGYIYITVPAYNLLWSNEDYKAGHFRRYTINDLNRLLKRSGYNIIYSTYIFSILPLPIFLFRKVPSILGFLKNVEKNGTHRSTHKKRNNLLGKLIERIWEWELSKIEKNKKIPFGGSCFLIGQKL
tara:strand:- start:3 stop:833 length:831 start_codon:yes stop_codon:yes gene_type:complete